MTANLHCRGLGCRFAQIGETTVWADDSRFEECEAILTGSPEADESVVYAERFVSPSVDNRDRCGYAAKMILQAQGAVNA